MVYLPEVSSIAVFIKWAFASYTLMGSGGAHQYLPGAAVHLGQLAAGWYLFGQLADLLCSYD